MPPDAVPQPERRFTLPFTTRKSAGIPVTAAVLRAIRAGDAARDRRDWEGAAGAYRAALDGDPRLTHIWVQLGHALKEARHHAEARDAYGRASALTPGSADPHLHLGHIAKLLNDRPAAARHYLAAFRAEPANADAAAELQNLLARATLLERPVIAEALQGGLADEADLEPPLDEAVAATRTTLDRLTARLAERSEAVHDADATLRRASAVLERIGQEIGKHSVTAATMADAVLVFDVSDLISYFRHARLPSGIQRVQIESITHALRMPELEVRICCFVDGRDDWLEVPPGRFAHLAALSVAEGRRDEPVWVGALARFHIELALAEPFAFPRGAYLVNLGTSWWLQNYFLFVRDAKERFGIRYIPFVHDMIPILTPEHCVRGLTQDFISWAIGVFQHADFFLANSESTKRDLIAVAATLRTVVDPADVAVIRLDGDFRRSGDVPDAGSLARLGIGDEPFALFVSTIESRKNHVGAFDAWSELIRRHGARNVPRLVCVGSKGWLNDAVYERLATDKLLARRVTMLSHLSDEDLRLLYRRCQFTLYPSLYEGWGLPVTESLCYGKVPVLSDSSSLPEAGGDFAVYFDTESTRSLVEAIEQVSFDPAHRATLEARIAARFRPRSWGEIANQINGEVRALAARRGSSPAAPIVPRAAVDAFYPVVRSAAIRIWPGMGSGEIFRAGTGWRWPEHWGCWTGPHGGALKIALPEGVAAPRLYLWLRGTPSGTTRFTVTAGGADATSGTLASDERRWVALDVMDGADVVEITLGAIDLREVVFETGSADLVGIGLLGFVLTDARDDASRAQVLETILLGDVTELDAYREMMPFTREMLDSR